MLTEEFVIDNETMDALRNRANKDGIKLKDLTERYIQFITNLRKTMSPEFKKLNEIQRRNRMAFYDLAADFNYKEEFGNELYKKYIG